MKKYILILIFLIAATCQFQVNAQSVGIGINSFTPDASSMLEIQSTTKGLLIPRVALTQTTSASPVTSPLPSLLIYNTANINDVKQGYYYWDGGKWVRFISLNGGSGTLNYVPKWTPDGTTLGNSQIFDDGTNVGIGTITPDFRFTVVDSTGEPTDLFKATGVFINKSVDTSGIGVVGLCGNEPGKGIGVAGLGGWAGVIGRSFQEGAGWRAGVFGQLEDLDAERKYAVVGHASGPGINYGIYGIATGGTTNWAGYFRNDVYVNTNLQIGTYGNPSLLYATGSVRFEDYTNGFLSVDANGYLGVSAATSLFTLGTGLSWNGSTLNSVWTSSGNNIYNNNTGNVGIGTASPGSPLTVFKSTSGGRGGEISIVNYAATATGNSAALNFGLEASTYAGNDGNAQIQAILNGENAASTDMSFSLWSGSAFNEYMRIKSTGNVGIGTISPSVPLQIQKPTTGPALMIGGANFGQPRIQVYGLDADANAWMGLGTDMSGSAYEHSVYFPTAGPGRLTIGDYNGTTFNTRMTVLANGNVGIGTASPGAKLQVTGDIVGSAQVFRAYMTTSYSHPGGWQQLPFDATVFNTLQGTFDGTNKRFTASRAGYYQISVTGYSSTAGTGIERYAIGVQKNGALEGFCGANYSASDTPLAGPSMIVYMNGSTDYVEIWAFSAIAAIWSSGSSGGHYMLWHMNYLGN